MAEKFEVRFAVEVRASSPEQAAAIARDMLLDLDTELHANVHVAMDLECPRAAGFVLPRS